MSQTSLPLHSFSLTVIFKQALATLVGEYKIQRQTNLSSIFHHPLIVRVKWKRHKTCVLVWV